MPIEKINYMASADTYPCRFIKVTGSFTAAQATANAVVIGVSQEGTSLVPIDGMTDANSVYCARTGHNLPYYCEGQQCLIEAGGAFSAGDFLVSDANGKAVAAAGNNTNVGARALQAATASGQLVRVEVFTNRTGVPS